MTLDRILLVDDEEHVIASLKRQLHRQPYEVFSAQSGEEGLSRLLEIGQLAVIISDFRMPGMDGVDFLAKSQELCPDAVRIMLTGSHETEVAIRAVNRGNVARFLSKPVSPEILISAINAAAEQHRLVISERNLLAELSIMQQIDRELNTTLDITRAMNITLDWAIRQSGSSAGLIGRVGNDNIQVMAFQGYGNTLSLCDGFLPAEKYNTLKQAGSNNYSGNDFITGAGGLFMEAKSHALVPIQRENVAIGILLLEHGTENLFSEKTTGFLVRLCDHAVIAISNAELYEAVKAANNAKSEFVSFVSHELKNPITSIGGFAELMEGGIGGPVNETQKEMLSGIRSGVGRMIALVSDLSDISRIESGHLQLDISPFSLNEAVHEAVKTLQPHFDEKSQGLTQQIPNDLPPVFADKNRTIQVITNLLSNAGKYSPECGKIILECEASTNLWDPSGSQSVIHLRVQDNGIGINPEDQQKIFRKFFRSSDVLDSETKGTGLGLNITKTLVELQGGKIWFESEFRKGSTFHFTIPIQIKAEI